MLSMLLDSGCGVRQTVHTFGGVRESVRLGVLVGDTAFYSSICGCPLVISSIGFCLTLVSASTARLGDVKLLLTLLLVL